MMQTKQMIDNNDINHLNSLINSIKSYIPTTSNNSESLNPSNLNTKM